jgi:hypothetical protein
MAAGWGSTYAPRTIDARVALHSQIDGQGSRGQFRRHQMTGTRAFDRSPVGGAGPGQGRRQRKRRRDKRRQMRPCGGTSVYVCVVAQCIPIAAAGTQHAEG